ncbi:hypothetical protein SAMN06265367_101369 [Algoriphagus winogradskyi]|uniref:Uncharacterized protein n=1 Tax=Algoriphagus winogradskyi TaxID=237017 RepID=A0ABY1NBJ4_9BACT|nr:hypothetical protein SAMN06265367_101369 [Algoriphagus winogradskyi]
MKTLPSPTYLFISEFDVKQHLKSLYPIVRVQVYGERLDEKPLHTLYIKFFERSTNLLNDYENSIRTIVKQYFAKALAFESEWIN